MSTFSFAGALGAQSAATFTGSTVGAIPQNLAVQEVSAPSVKTSSLTANSASISGNLVSGGSMTASTITVDEANVGSGGLTVTGGSVLAEVGCDSVDCVGELNVGGTLSGNAAYFAGTVNSAEVQSSSLIMTPSSAAASAIALQPQSNAYANSAVYINTANTAGSNAFRFIDCRAQGSQKHYIDGTGTTWQAGDLEAQAATLSSATVTGDVSCTNANVSELTASGDVTVNGTLYPNGPVTMSDDLTVTGTTTLGTTGVDTLSALNSVSGNSGQFTNLNVGLNPLEGALTVYGTGAVSNSLTVGTTLDVTGTSTLNGSTYARGSLFSKMTIVTESGTTNRTYTPAQVANVIIDRTIPSAGVASNLVDRFPTAANLVNTYGLTVGDSFFTILKADNQNATYTYNLAASTSGGTNVGLNTVPVNGKFIFTYRTIITNATPGSEAYTVYRQSLNTSAF